MVHEGPQNTLAIGIRALAAKIHHDPGVEQSDLPNEYRNARKAILDKGTFSDEDIRVGKFDHEIHAMLVHEISSKYNISEERAAKHVHSMTRRIRARLGSVGVAVIARIVGPAGGATAGLLVGKVGTSFFGLSAGTLGASLMGALPILALVGGGIWAGNRAARWSGEALEVSRIVKEIWANPSKRDQLRNAVIGEQNLLPIITQLHLEHKTPEMRKHISTVIYSALGIALGTVGAGAISATADPGLMGRIALSAPGRGGTFIENTAHFAQAFFKEGVGLLTAPVLNLWKYVAGGIR